LGDSPDSASASVRQSASDEPGKSDLAGEPDGHETVLADLDEGALAAVVARLAAETLRRGEFDPDHDFFAAGAHSITALRLIARLRRELGVDLPFRWIFQERTPAALAQRILAEQETTKG
jgi:aryl carrier-like protein